MIQDAICTGWTSTTERPPTCPPWRITGQVTASPFIVKLLNSIVPFRDRQSLYVRHSLGNPCCNGRTAQSESCLVTLDTKNTKKRRHWVHVWHTMLCCNCRR
ncbi:hypothetical protein M378DRAFT_164629 [Amanita muscaria Koide BX008]|uniref:Uncharacterized protein n=1 Tax=Amanita muscaria (strain Koide BX008) TaxID=946122 RepID=A0A0C2X3M3_AMAMK|nr:hypothetical protein M378DRAFT_164629 [Amanita muscaria Koide BX008]